jgi:hypothetical protein
MLMAGCDGCGVHTTRCMQAAKIDCSHEAPHWYYVLIKLVDATRGVCVCVCVCARCAGCLGLQCSSSSTLL